MEREFKDDLYFRRVPVTSDAAGSDSEQKHDCKGFW